VRSLKFVSFSIASIIILFMFTLSISVLSTAHAIGVNATINAGPYPTGVVYDSVKGYIVTANYKTSVQGSNSANRISFISDSTNKLVDIPVTIARNSTQMAYLGYPLGLAYAPDQNLIFVSCAAGGVAAVSDQDGKVVATVRVGVNPNGIVYDSGKKEVFVANTGLVSASAGTVSVIDSNFKVIATIPVGKSPTGLAYDSGTGEIYVTNAGSNTVSVISDKTNEVVATVNVDAGPTGVAYDFGMHEVFVSNTHSSTVSVISDADNHRLVATITKISSPGNMAYDSGKGQIWVINSFGVSVISDKNNQVIASVGVGQSPYGVAYDSGKGEIFVTNSYDDTVSMISDSFKIPNPTQTTGSLRVDVKDAKGGILSGVAVSSASQPSGQAGLSGTTGSDGSVTFSSVAPGSYTLQASKSGYVAGTGAGSVVAGSSASVSISLQTQASGGGSGGVPGFPVEATVLSIILIVFILSVRKYPSY
jgi:YVTN family beta-propeller protein